MAVVSILLSVQFFSIRFWEPFFAVAPVAYSIINATSNGSMCDCLTSVACMFSHYLPSSCKVYNKRRPATQTMIMRLSLLPVFFQ